MLLHTKKLRMKGRNGQSEASGFTTLGVILLLCSVGMILLAITLWVKFGGAFVSGNQGTKESFDVLVDGLKEVDDAHAEEDRIGARVFAIEDFYLYGFGIGVGEIRGDRTAERPERCYSDDACLCICQSAKCEDDKIIECSPPRVFNMINQFAAKNFDGNDARDEVPGLPGWRYLAIGDDWLKAKTLYFKRIGSTVYFSDERDDLPDG
ncbi:hypothetical protein JXB11_01140 [Candidatus Woesearchaeota archaeon]|nr:hypothetical protein [Candidatus Woesearchaeota archaeon]